MTSIAGRWCDGAADYPTTLHWTCSRQAEVKMEVHASGHLASNLIGGSVYKGTGPEAENIGKVTDIVISDDGRVELLLSGWRLPGIGQKEVALQYDVAMWGKREGDRWLVVETNADALKVLDDFDRSAYLPMPAGADVAEPMPDAAENQSAERDGLNSFVMRLRTGITPQSS